jgi:hypothetical protein
VEFIVNDEMLMPETVMDLWINGSYFHADEEKVRRLEQLAKVPMSRWLFINAVAGATKVIFYVDHLIGIALRDCLVSDSTVR